MSAWARLGAWRRKSASVSDLTCSRCGYDLRVQVSQRAQHCPECGLVLPEIPAKPADTYEARYARWLACMRVRLQTGWGVHTERVPHPRSRPATVHFVLLAIFIVVLLWSGIGPKDRFTWVLEVAPAVLGAIVLVVAYPRFRFTTLVYALILLHACILCLGGHYTYAEVPLGFLVQDALGLARNHYDRLGHFAQGFVPAMIARELLLRTSPLRPGKWLSAIVVSTCLAVSAGYELIEWAVAVATGEAADAFLGTQGDVWDTQWDMFLALIGAVTALLVFSRIHNRLLGLHREQ